MKRPSRTTPCVLLLALAIVALDGCGPAERLVGALAEVNSLRDVVAKEFNEPLVSVNLHNDRYLTIGLVNSKQANTSDEEKQLLARRVAAFAYAHYKHRQDLEKVNVAFVKHSSFLIFNYTDSTDVYGFESSELQGTAQ